MKPAHTIQELQQIVDRWISENGGYWDEMSLLARLTEEVGELAREVNHLHGAKKNKPSKDEGDLAGELADVLWLVICMANKAQIDLEQAFLGVMTKLQTRDADRWK